MIRILVYILLLATLSYGQENIRTSFSYITLEKKLNYIDTLLSRENQLSFQPLFKEKSKFGFVNKIFWIRVDTKNVTNTSKEVVLELNHPSLDYIDIYQEDKKTLILKKELGDLRPYDKSIFMPNPTYTFILSPQASTTLYVRVQSQGSMNLGITLKEMHTYTLDSSKQIKWFSFYIGAVFIMLMYNFLIFIIVRNKNFLYYVIFHMVYLLFALSLSGIAFELFWPNTPKLNLYIIPLTIPLVGIFSILFSIEFLSIKKQSLRIYHFLILFVFICMATLFLPFILNYHISIMIGSLLSVLIALTLMITAIYIYISNKDINALFYLIAWSFFSIGVLISQFSNIGLIPSTLYTNFASQIGSFFEVLLLSIGLAYYYNHLHLQHKELTNLNQTLQHLSNTDALTQSYNRRYFYATVKTLLNQITHNNFFLLMLDLDYFKNINDTYGHEVGDKVLQTITKLCQKELKTDEIFARYGGEEFVLFLPKSSKEEVIQLIDVIQHTIYQIDIQDIDKLKLTVSIGISQDEKELDTLLSYADKALYRAKNSGRNTFCFYTDIK